VTAKSVPAGEGWVHEPKLDRYRLQVVKDDSTVRLYSRRGHDWGKRLAALAESLRAIPTRSAILDAELCLPGRDGAPNFYGLMARMHNRQHELAVYAFDLMHLDGEDLRPLPLTTRRRRMERLLGRAKVPCLHLVEAFDDGQALLEAAERHRLEGVVSKRRDAPYRSGESRDWRKIKTAAWREANRERWRLFEPRSWPRQMRE
jgi:bifunctional non-homologous end joining protein LigD